MKFFHLLITAAVALAMKVWNLHVLCDGVPAGHRAAWCVDNHGSLGCNQASSVSLHMHRGGLFRTGSSCQYVAPAAGSRESTVFFPQ